MDQVEAMYRQYEGVNVIHRAIRPHSISNHVTSRIIAEILIRDFKAVVIKIPEASLNEVVVNNLFEAVKLNLHLEIPLMAFIVNVRSKMELNVNIYHFGIVTHIAT